MSRLARIAGSFAIVMIAYWTYALLAAPWIEPTADLAADSAIGNNGPRTDTYIDLQVKSLEGIFPKGSWQLKEPKILDFNRAKLLFQEYRNLGDGRVEIHPCTIVFPHEGPADSEAQRRRQTIVLEAPQGATLQFDQPLDLGRAKVGRLVGGMLQGEVAIRSDCKRSGPEDDLRITTRDIQITEQTISTPEPVDFRWGPHFGRGRDMRIQLLADPAGDPTVGANIAGIDSFELRHVERLHLELGQAIGTEKGTGPIDRNGPKGASHQLDLSPFPSAGQTDAEVPVEIRCHGPFRFDVVRRVATFRDKVDVMKQNASGPSDQIACEVLSLFFAKNRGSTADDSSNSQLDMVAERLEALGNPVVVTAPTHQLNARAPRIEYNLLERSIALTGAKEVFLQQAGSEIHAHGLRYQAAEEGRLGIVDAEGPGWLRGRFPDRPDQTLTAAWNGLLRVYPHEQNQIISLSGGANLNLHGMGTLQANEIFFWLDELPPTDRSPRRLQPNRMLARDDVRIRAARLSGRVEQLEIWFEEMRNTASGIQDSGSKSPTTAVVGGSAGGNSIPTESSSQQFEVTGRLLRAKVLLGGAEPAVSHLLLADGARFAQAQTAQPDERPLVVTGERIEATHATSPNATVTVLGRPARFEARGMGLTGTNIHLDRAQNRLWIDGPGQMDMPFSGGMFGQTATEPGVLTVDWRGRMDFRERQATFTDHVVVAGPQQRMTTETMEVQFNRPIRFSEPAMQGPPQVETIRCPAPTELQNRGFDPQRQLNSFDRIHVADLGVNVLSGEITAGGPGWFNHVGPANDNPLGKPRNIPVAASAGDKLQCLHVKFAGSISGNLLRRRLTFHDRVRTAYAPVGDWDAMLQTDNPDQLGPGGALIQCDELSVVQMLLPVDGSPAFEAEARGNAKVENATFRALGDRIAYAEAKDLLILEGSGLTDAELLRQARPGDPASRIAAKKIWYWPKSNRLSIDGARSLQTQ